MPPSTKKSLWDSFDLNKGPLAKIAKHGGGPDMASDEDVDQAAGGAGKAAKVVGEAGAPLKVDKKSWWENQKTLFSNAIDAIEGKSHRKPSDIKRGVYDKWETTKKSLWDSFDLNKGDLSAEDRADLPKKDFAICSKADDAEEKKESGNYPIPDESHARFALAMVAKHGTPAEKARVRAAVHKKYPSIGESDVKKSNWEGFDLVKAGGPLDRLKSTRKDLPRPEDIRLPAKRTVSLDRPGPAQKADPYANNKIEDQLDDLVHGERPEKKAVADRDKPVTKSIDPALAARINTPAQTRRGANVDPQTASRGMFNINISKAFGSGPGMYTEQVRPQRVGGPRNLSKAKPTPAEAEVIGISSGGTGGQTRSIPADDKVKGRSKSYSRTNPDSPKGGEYERKTPLKGKDSDIGSPQYHVNVGEYHRRAGSRFKSSPRAQRVLEDEEYGFPPPKEKPAAKKKTPKLSRKENPMEMVRREIAKRSGRGGYSEHTGKVSPAKPKPGFKRVQEGPGPVREELTSPSRTARGLPSQSTPRQARRKNAPKE
jgi:hypothetical protein